MAFCHLLELRLEAMIGGLRHQGDNLIMNRGGQESVRRRKHLNNDYKLIHTKVVALVGASHFLLFLDHEPESDVSPIG